MDMQLEVYTFIIFIFIGILISIVFDFFRSMRMRKVYKDRQVQMQDMLFLIITCVIITASAIFFLKEKLRLYIFVAMLFGITMYILYLSKYVILLFNALLKFLEKIFASVSFLFNFVEKGIKRCCKAIKNVICLLYKRIPKIKFKEVLYEKNKSKKQKL